MSEARLRSAARDRRSHVLALLREHGGQWSRVPTDAVAMANALHRVNDMPAEELAALETEALSARRERGHSAASRRSPPRGTKSKLAAYIRRPVAGAEAKRTSHDSAALTRALLELKLKVPPFRRLMANHGTDLTDERIQMACFADVFSLVDEYGHGCASVEDLEHFGLKVGPAVAKVLHRATFAPVLAAEQQQPAVRSTLTRESFMAAIFPHADPSARAAAAHPAAAGDSPSHAATSSTPRTAPSSHHAKSAGSSAAAATSGTPWHPDDLACFQRIMHKYGDGRRISVAKLFGAVSSDAVEAARGSPYAVDDMLRRLDADGDGWLTFDEAAQLFKPSFEASRRSDDTEDEMQILRVQFR